MRIYGNFFYNRLPVEFQEEELFYSGLDLSGKTVLEAGTHIGVFTYLFAQTADRVIAFEPNPRTYAMVKRNVSANHLTNVRLVNAGLSDHSGEAKYVAEKFVSGRGTFKTDKHERIKGKTKHVVETMARLTTVDEEAAGLHIDFVKIDTEGYEPMVLGGMTETVQRCQPDIYFEIHGLNDTQQSDDFLKMFEMLPGYRILKLVHGLPIATPDSGLRPGGGYIAFVQERDYLSEALKAFRT